MKQKVLHIAKLAGGFIAGLLAMYAAIRIATKADFGFVTSLACMPIAGVFAMAGTLKLLKVPNLPLVAIIEGIILVLVWAGFALWAVTVVSLVLRILAG